MFKLVYIGPEFKVMVYRLLITGIIILAAFNFGSWFYLFSASRFDNKVETKTFATMLRAATDKDLQLDVDGRIIAVKSEELKTWVEPYTRSYSGKEDLRISSKMSDYLKSLAETINTPPVNAKLIFEGNRAKEFTESAEGKKFNIEGSAASIIKALGEGKDSAQLVVEKIEPEITLEKINNLGIETLLSRGESNFSGSSAARIHNIRTGANRFNGTILKPGEEFSFNNILGEVDGSTGYQYELVIKNGKTTPEYGGGLCQVSTTAFRAAILAGFPIIERRPHSFPVKYYNPQGFDATIYPGVTDLRFLNDTKGHVLLQTKIEGGKLFVEIYGSDDGRQVAVDGPHQYDQKPSGALKAYFTRNISYADGKTKNERFDSNYRPPYSQARNPLE